MTDTSFARLIQDVRDETLKQDAKWGAERKHGFPTWMEILVEEVGETAKADLEYRYGGEPIHRVRDELVQVAAVALQFIEHVDRIMGS